MVSDVMLGAGLGTLLAGFIVAFFVVFLIMYVYVAIALMTIAKKTKTEPSWIAWIPIANVYLMTKIAGLDWWWTLIILLGGIVPFVGGFVALAASLYVWWKMCEVCHKPGWLSLLLLIPVVGILIVPGILAWSK